MKNLMKNPINILSPQPLSDCQTFQESFRYGRTLRIKKRKKNSPLRLKRINNNKLIMDNLEDKKI